jgi:hypothetical protein
MFNYLLPEQCVRDDHPLSSVRATTVRHLCHGAEVLFYGGCGLLLSRFVEWEEPYRGRRKLVGADSAFMECLSCNHHRRHAFSLSSLVSTYVSLDDQAKHPHRTGTYFNVPRYAGGSGEFKTCG